MPTTRRQAAKRKASEPEPEPAAEQQPVQVEQTAPAVHHVASTTTTQPAPVAAPAVHHVASTTTTQPAPVAAPVASVPAPTPSQQPTAAPATAPVAAAQEKKPAEKKWTGSSSSLNKRIHKELVEITEDPPTNCRHAQNTFINTKISSDVGPIGDSLLEWSAVLLGPQGSPYAGGRFQLSIFFPSDYPFKPPKARAIYVS
jgi:hypothetical protein